MCWIIPLIVGVISAILGYLLGKSSCDCENSPVATKLREENEELKKQLSECEARKKALVEEQEAIKASLAEEKAKTAKLNANAGHAVLGGVKVKEKVKGIFSHFAKTDNKADTEYSAGKASHFASTDDTTDFHSHKEGAKETSHFASTEDSKEFHSESKGSGVVSHFAVADSKDVDVSVKSDDKSNQVDTNEAVKFDDKQAAKLTGHKVATFDADLAKSVFGKKIKQDDLTVVEGIGPKIAELFNEAGIKTWAELAETSVERRQEILTAAGTRFAVHNPDTWARQAQLAADGKWQELLDWQDELDGGVEV